MNGNNTISVTLENPLVGEIGSIGVKRATLNLTKLDLSKLFDFASQKNLVGIAEKKTISQAIELLKTLV